MTGRGPSRQPTAAEDRSAFSGGLGAGWLRAVATGIDRVPSWLWVGLACSLLALLVLFEFRRAQGMSTFPFYYVIPLVVLAWFAGGRWALLAAAAACAVTFSILAMDGTLANGSAVVLLGRLFTFVVAALIARGFSRLRVIFDVIYRNPGWRAMKRPLRVGARLLIVPILPSGAPREDIDVTPDIVPVYIQAGLAFGTASHPTTRMCLELLEQAMRTGATVLDVGCGTGILSIAAAKLGAAHVYAVDKYLRAVQVARLNLEHNAVVDRVTLLRGSLVIVGPGSHPGDDSDSATFSTDDRFDLILANLLAPVIRELLSTGLAELLPPSGRLIASGIKSAEMDSLRPAFTAAGLSLDQLLEEEGWCAVVARQAGRLPE
jgi:ribosomal protein L11 methyltransferase